MTSGHKKRAIQDSELRRRAEKMLQSSVTDIPRMSAEEIAGMLQDLEVHRIELELQNHELEVQQVELERHNEELRQAQLELKESRDSYASLYDFTPVGYFTLDEDNRFVKANLTACRMFGLERSKLLNTRLTNFIVPADADAFYFCMKDAYDKGESAACELQMQRHDGTLFYADVRIEPVTQAGEKPHSCRIAVIDITERKVTVEALEESEKKYRGLFRSMSEGFGLHEVILDTQGRPCDYRYIEVNDAFEKLTGLSREDLIGRTVKEVLPGIESYWIETYGKVALTGEPVHFENYSAPLKRWYATYAYSPEKLQFAVVFMDITEPKNALGALQESEERFRIMADSSPLMIWVTDPAGNIQFVNRAYGEFFGVTLEQVRGLNWQPFIHPGDSEMYIDGFFSSLAERKPFRAEARVRRADGEWRWVESLGAPRFSQSGEFLGMVGSSPDVTERKNAEEELHRYREHLEELVANRTRDLRELAHRLVDTQEKERARVGNELHDEIGQILTYTTLLIDRSVRKQDHTALPEAKTAIQEAIARVRNLSSVLSPFLLRSAGLMPALVSLTGEYVRRTNIKIDFDQNGKIEGVAEDVALATYRIVQEALTNVARHANASEIYLRLAREPGRLRLEIADNGTGFDPGAVKKSTGLAGMRERAMALGGVLSIEPNGRQGTRIVADLPLPD